MCNGNPFSGGFWSQGNCLSDAYGGASQAANTAYDWANNQANNIACQNGLGNGIFGGAFSCGSSGTSSSCSPVAGTFQEDMDQAKANYNRDFTRISKALNEGDITPKEFQQKLLDIVRISPGRAVLQAKLWG